MKRVTYIYPLIITIILAFNLLADTIAYGQCVNADFESGNFNGWTGTFCINGNGCSNAGGGFLGGLLGGLITGGFPDPFKCPGIDLGTTNQASNATPEKNHFIMTSGFDAILGGSSIPVVCPGGGSKSARLGNAQAAGGGESMMYKFVVTANNSLFTYNYAVVLNDGGHQVGQQPYFKIRMFVYNSATDSTVIDCATYDVDGNTAKTIGGFTANGDILWKSWSAVTVPLKAYIGKTVSIQFSTRDCCPDCDASGKGTGGGSHYAFAYIDASCSQLQIIPSAPSVCAGKTVTLTAPTSASYSWAGPTTTSIVSGANSQAAIVNTPGTYTVTLTPFGNNSTTNACNYDLTVVMPANLSGGANVSVNSVTTCVGSTAMLTASGGVSYTWAPGGQATPTISAPTTNAGTTTYTVTGASATCGSGSAIATVVVSPLPTSPFTVTSVCVGESSTITYTGNASPSDTYTWDFAGGTVVSGSGQGPYSVTWPNAGSKNVTLKVTIGNCISPITTNAVTVSPLKNATFSYNPPTVCKAGGTNPQPILAGTPGGIFACAADANLIINPNSGIIDLSLTPLGTYTVTYTLGAPCPDQSSFVINIVNKPIADFTFGTYCQNDPNPSPTFINGGTAGVFSSTAGLVFVNTSTGEINLAASNPGTYSVTNAINSPGCPPVSATSSITIKPIPTVTLNNQSICVGGTATLTAGGADTYLWSNASTATTLTDTPPSTTTYTVTGTAANCSSSKIGTITVNPYPTVTVNDATICKGAAPAILTASGASMYLWSTGAAINTLSDSPTATNTYTVTGTKNGCSTSAIATITVNPLPVITVNSPAICQGLSGLLSPSGANSYKWSDNTYIGNKNITPLATKTYTVYGSTANCSGMPTTTPSEINAYLTCWSGGCTNSAVSTVTLILKPIIVVNSPTICVGQSTILVATGGATYDWSSGESGNTITVSPITTTSYTVADNTIGCSGSSVSKVTVNPLPIVSVNSATICAGQSAILTASGASTYSWSNGAAVNPLVVPLQNNTTYTVIGTSAVGCKDTAITTVIVNPLPVVTASSSSVCDGLTTTVTASGALTYQWSNGATTNPLSISPNKTTHYTATGTDANGCTATATSSVTVFPKPGTDFTITPQPAFVTYPNITFTDKSSKDVNYWHWDFGDGDTLAPDKKNPEHMYPKVEATYNVTLHVLNGGFCPNWVTHQVVIGPDYSFFIPNAFSPNGDGENDTFFGKGKGILDYELMIFDRWGNFIFYANDINKEWDGKANGGADEAQQDVYVWKVNLTDVYKKKHSFIGTVTLIRGE